MFSVLLFLAIQSVQAERELQQLERETEAPKKTVELANSPQGQMCESHVGRTIKSISFDAAAAKYPPVAPKGEFEKTEAYEERRKTARPVAGGSFVIGVPVDREQLEYDADNEELQIGALAFGELGFPETGYTNIAASLALGEFGVDNNLFGDNVAVTVDSSEKVTGTYTAQNSFGASARVQKISVRTKSIFDRKIELSSWAERPAALFPRAMVEPQLAGTLPASPEVAKKLKSSLRLALLVEPKAPYFVKWTMPETPRATFRKPRELTDTVEIIIADIQCGFALDSGGKVLAVFATN